MYSKFHNHLILYCTAPWLTAAAVFSPTAELIVCKGVNKCKFWRVLFWIKSSRAERARAKLNSERAEKRKSGKHTHTHTPTRPVAFSLTGTKEKANLNFVFSERIAIILAVCSARSRAVMQMQSRIEKRAGANIKRSRAMPAPEFASLLDAIFSRRGN